jgi:hypothetical protein
MRRWLGITALLATGACDDGLDVYSLIEDLRVIGMRADPPEMFFDVDTPEVRFSALVVSPKGDAITYSFGFCPVESSYGCDDIDDKLQFVDSEFIDNDDLKDLRDLNAIGPSSAGRVSGPGEPTIAEHQRFEVEPLVLPAASSGLGPTGSARVVPGNFEMYFQQVGFYGFGMGGRPSGVLTASDGTDSIIAQKRLTVGLSDYTVANEIVEETLGYRFCTTGETAADGCLEFGPRVANTNPEFDPIEPFFVHQGDTAVDEDEFESPPLNISVFTEQFLRILPRFTTASVETYPVLKGDLETSEIFVDEYTEEISVSWFCTAGELQDDLTWPKFTKTLDTVYTAPKEPPEDTDGLVTIWMVARDQRGGEAWHHLQILIQ